MAVEMLRNTGSVNDVQTQDCNNVVMVSGHANESCGRVVNACLLNRAQFSGAPNGVVYVKSLGLYCCKPTPELHSGRDVKLFVL